MDLLQKLKRYLKYQKQNTQVTLKVKTIRCRNLSDLPPLDTILSLPRNVKLKVIFEQPLEEQRQKYGEYWKEKLTNFLVGVHTTQSEINVQKLISEEEVKQHQLFFEKCAKEYGRLGEQLIMQFEQEFNIEPHNGFPLETINPSDKSNYSQTGQMDKWRYYLHGIHCAFVHKETSQRIEVPLTFGEEYGALDPYFFVNFIKTTPEFQPVPVPIYNAYHDGQKILEVMTKIGKFEHINSNWKDVDGVIVVDRIKKKVKIYS